MGKMPLNECRRRHQKALPWPVRNGAIPDGTGAVLIEAEELAVATATPAREDCSTKPLIIGAALRESQESADRGSVSVRFVRDLAQKNHPSQTAIKKIAPTIPSRLEA
jgi:hypothetical protein